MLYRRFHPGLMGAQNHMPGQKIVESEASLAARRAAESFGDVEGSSYSMFEDRPVVWAFDVIRSPHRLIVAGHETLPLRVLLLVDEEHAFSGMLYGKALAAYSYGYNEG